MHHYEQPEDESPPPASQPLRTAFHNKAPANHLDGGLLIMVGPNGNCVEPGLAVAHGGGALTATGGVVDTSALENRAIRI